MVNWNVLIGVVRGVVHNERNDLLLVEEYANPAHPQMVACEFFGDKTRKLLEGIGDGDLVRVAGSTRSREYQGKWFTTFSAYKVNKVVLPDTLPRRFVPDALDNSLDPF